MKQINEAVQALEIDIGFWRPSWILLKKLKNAKKIPGKCMQFHSDAIISTSENSILTVAIAGFLGCDLYYGFGL